ncbi:NAD-dependent epimerase/dehydratase family protein [Macellibacteroides fermentans]|jgi:nucleoside-diphosphate-sugar epimerase|uniref:NAD-dependent epimerase/dehydratase family protein n=1 Tax=Macellibacteroides fermentans TaxID=879969 RepID=UPI003B92B73C
MKLLLTGSSGFIGNNIKMLLQNKYQLKTLGLSPNDDYNVNLSKDIPFIGEKYDIVFHAAGKAHTTPESEAEKKAFFDVNFQGTKNLCTALENCGVPKSFIYISSVAVYGCEYGENITEETPLNGKTPYALSKIMAEKFLVEWCAKNKVILSIIRPSLVAGPNPPGNLGAMINGIKTRKYVRISGGKARKSVLMVQDIANIVPLLAEKGGIYNVCDSYQPSFRELEELIALQLGKSIPLSIPYPLAKVVAKSGDYLGGNAPINTIKLSKITKSLTFSNEKARKELGWTPLNVLDNFKIS